MIVSSKSIILNVLIVSLYGCDLHIPTDLNVSSTSAVSGYTTSITKDNITEVSCSASSSGKCYFVYFTDTCAVEKPDSKTTVDTCTKKILEEFSLSVSETKNLESNIAESKNCISYISAPEVPGCYKEK
jgi:hypothetical protein